MTVSKALNLSSAIPYITVDTFDQADTVIRKLKDLEPNEIFVTCSETSDDVPHFNEYTWD